MISRHRPLVVSLVTVALFAPSLSSAAANDTTETYAAGTLYLADANSGADIPEGTSLAYDAPLVGLPAPGDVTTPFPNAQGATGIFAFLSPQGGEADPSTWNSYEGLGEPLSTGLSLPPLTPLGLLAAGMGSPSGNRNIQAAGGDFSLGVAFTTDNGASVVERGLYFVHVHITPGSGDFTWRTIDPATVIVEAPTGGGSTSGTEVAGGLLSFTTPATGTGSTVIDERTGGTGWALVVSTAEEAHTLRSGASGDTQVDVPAADAATVTITLVSG